MSFNHIFNAKNHTMFVGIVHYNTYLYIFVIPMALQCTIIHCFYDFLFLVLFFCLFFSNKNLSHVIAVNFQQHTQCIFFECNIHVYNFFCQLFGILSPHYTYIQPNWIRIKKKRKTVCCINVSMQKWMNKMTKNVKKKHNSIFFLLSTSKGYFYYFEN